jgi:aspartate/methionine/tyrosine aminotransferase
MLTLDEKFKALEADNAPGQEVRQDEDHFKNLIKGENLGGLSVDFSHGDIDAFEPIPETEKVWQKGFKKGGNQAYTEYRGDLEIRKSLAKSLGDFTGKPIIADKELILTPGTQGALFLALGATVSVGTKVVVVEPDYFANRKLVKFFNGVVVPIPLHYLNELNENGPDLNSIETAFKNGVKVFVFSTPNNPTGLVYSKKSIETIVTLASKYGVTLIIDQLYSRMLFEGETYTHARACNDAPKNIITIMGPSKTESLSGYRLGVAFGTPVLIDRMERLQAIVSLRTAGYNQYVFNSWFNEPEGWLTNRIQEHQAIRDELLLIFRTAGFLVASPQAGSYLFPKLPPLTVSLNTFVKLLRHQANVIVTPASEFAPQLNDSIRLNFSQDHSKAVAAAKRIVKMVEIYKS